MPSRCSTSRPGAPTFRRRPPGGCPRRWAARARSCASAPTTAAPSWPRRSPRRARAPDRRSPPWTRAARSSSPTRTRASSSASRRACRRSTPRSAGKPGLDLGRLARHAIKQARLDHDWVGSTQIVTELSSEPCRITLRPVFLADQPIGTLALFGSEHGDPIERERPEPRLSPPARIVGVSGERMVLLHRPEVHFAEADGNDVWLVTDEGRLQAAVRGIDKLEEELAGGEFLRVHRRFLVNLSLRPRGRARAEGRAVADHGRRGARGGARVAPQRPGRAARARALDPRGPLHRAIDELVGRAPARAPRRRGRDAARTGRPDRWPPRRP